MLRGDAFTRAGRVAALLRQAAAVTDESASPLDLWLREFIGGGCCTY